MTAKDYWRIANALHKARTATLGVADDRATIAQAGRLLAIAEAAHVAAIDLAAEHIADELAADNPRFDRHRFLSAVWGAGVTR